MSKLTGRAFPFGLGALVVAAVLALGVTARADVTTEESGSIVVWPKVVNFNDRDTVIQLANTGNTLVHAHCYYTNAQLLNPEAPAGPFNPPLWQEVDFFIWLTRQQPTHWRVSTGRPVSPFDLFGTPGAGIDPGSVPPVPANFVGDLVCVEVDSDDNPVSGNKLKGEALLQNVNSGDVSKYSAIAILGGPNAGATGRELQLDNDQYNSCPNVLMLNHFAQGVTDPVVEEFGLCPDGDCPIDTELTLTPCQRDYENQVPGTVNVFFEIYNEFENRFSTTTSVTCWLNLELEDIGSGNVFTPSVLGSLTALTRIEPQGTSGGLLGVAEEFHRGPGDSGGAAAAFSLFIEGSRFDPGAGRDIIDRIVLVGE